MNNNPVISAPAAPGSAGFSRRRFLGGSAAVGATSMFSSLLTMQHFASAAAAQDGGDDYKALVCVFLFGGNDSFNMLIPTEAAEFATYTTARSDFALQGVGADNPLRGPYLPLALDPSSPNAVRSNDGTERSFALHPAMPEMQTIFDDGDLAFVSNVGTLSQPMTVEQYQAAVDGNSPLEIPKALFSHSDQQLQWRNGRPNFSASDGWAGRFPEAVTGLNQTIVPMHISLAGNNNWQANAGEGLYTISATGSRSLAGSGTTNGSNINRIRFEAVVGGDISGISLEESFAGAEYPNALKQHYMDQVIRTTELHEVFSEDFGPAYSEVHTKLAALYGLDPNDPDVSVMTDTPLEASLKAIAATIGAREEIGMRRQVFYLGIGSFDDHNELLASHHEKLGYVSQALGKFWDALGEIGERESVVTFTASEFARTLKSNGKGTDHGWGGNQLVMGGPVDGKKVFGSYPEDLSLGGPADVESNGRLLPTTSIDEFGGEMATWFGVPDSDLDVVFPNADRFYDVTANPNPVGFLAASQPPGEDLVEVVESCFGTPAKGRFDIYVTNNTASDNEYVISLSRLAPRLRTIAAGATHVETITARPDGEYTLSVTRTIDAKQVFTGNYVVDCFVPVPWKLITSCLSQRGRIDLWIENPTDFDALFETTYTHAEYGPIVKTRRISGGAIQRESVTGRQYGDWHVEVRNVTSNELVFKGDTTVLCGLPDKPAVIRRSCMITAPIGARGRVDVDLWNDGATTRHYRVVVERSANPLIGRQERNVTLTADERDIVTVTGRANLDYDVIVSETTAAGLEIGQLATATIPFDC